MNHFFTKTHSRERHTARVPERTVIRPREPGRDEIARLAYSYWEAGGRMHGRHLQDWLRAERELRDRNAPIA